MPIQSLTSSSVHHRCIACGESRVLGLDQLEVGVFDEHLEGPAAAMVALPRCARCASVEFLIGSSESAPEDPYPGSYGHRLRLLVDQLHAELVDADQLSERARSKPLRLRRPTADQLAQWFPEGLEIKDEPAAVRGPHAS